MPRSRRKSVEKTALAANHARNNEKTSKMECKHKFVHLGNNSFYRENGRYSYLYRSVDTFFCENCLEEKEKVKEISVNTGEELPDWAKTITQKVASNGRF
jgi:hypothetical protein